jgi:hypothetical protein
MITGSAVPATDDLCFLVENDLRLRFSATDLCFFAAVDALCSAAIEGLCFAIADEVATRHVEPDAASAQSAANTQQYRGITVLRPLITF